MSHRMKLFRNIGIGLGALICLVVIGTLVIVQTAWFANFVRQQIVSATEAGTGGRVEIGSFRFQVSGLRATITDFVVHGKEPAGAAPFLRADRVEVHIRLFTSFRHILDVTYLAIDRPAANIMLLANGSTNIPEPKTKSNSNKSALETIVDLAVGHFELRDGLLTVESRKQPFDLRGNNLKAQLDYIIASQAYQGQIALDPLYVVAGRNTPVVFKITMPVSIQRDRIDFNKGTITTPLSTIALSGSIENVKNPRISAHVNGRIATADLKNALSLPLDLKARNVPSEVSLDLNAAEASDSIQITGMRAGLGRSNVEASGTLKDPKGNGSLALKTQLDTAELGRLLDVGVKPAGNVVVNANVSLDTNNEYQLNGNLQTRDLSFQQGKQRIRNVSILTAVHLDPHTVDLKGLRLGAFGGEFVGDASLQDFSRYKVNGDLRHLDIRTAASALGEKLPYDGTASGRVDAEGDAKAPGTKSIMGKARLVISPGKRGIPVSGRLNAEYNGATDSISVENSFIALPHSRITLNGSVGRKLNVVLTSSDLNDFLAAANVKSLPKIAFDRGQATFTGAVTGSLSAPRITGHLAAARFTVEGRRFDSLNADLAASSSSAAIQNGLLSRGMMQAQFSASVGMRNWSPRPRDPLMAELAIRNADLADVATLAGQSPADYSGALTASAHIMGTVGNPQGAATLQASMGSIMGQPFDQIQTQVNLADRLVSVPSAFIQAGQARVNLSAEYRHPQDSFTTGLLHAHVQSNQVDLSQIRALKNQAPDMAGQFQVNADVTGSLANSDFLLSNVNADVSGRSLRYRGADYGNLTASAKTNGQTVAFNVSDAFSSTTVRVNGTTQLLKDYPTTADASLSNLPVERVLLLANRRDIPAKGDLSGTAHITGTIKDPQGNADLTLARAVVYGEPVDRAEVQGSWLPRAIDVPRFEIVSGPSRIDLSAHYDHPLGDLARGTAQFNVNTSRIDLARIHNIQQLRPGLGGTLQITANGSGEVRPGTPPILFSKLDANISATGLAAQGKNLGNLTLKANTTGTNRLDFNLDSNLADAAIHGAGNAQLSGDYPVNAQLTFNNVLYSHVQTLLGTGGTMPPAFEGAVDGQVTVNGPVLKTDQLRGSFQLSRLNLTTIPRPGAGKPITITNQGPVSASLDAGTVRIQSAHLTGPQTDIQLTGTASLGAQTLNLSLNADANLGLLQDFDRDIDSSGKVALNTTIRGTVPKPLINGQLTLQNASFNYSGISNGISNANGVVVFNGNNATIRTLTAESGGGQVSVTGFAGFSDNIRFGLRATGNNIRVRIQEGVSVLASADVRLTGVADASVISGTATINKVTYNPQSDIGSILSRAAPPVQSPTAPSPILENMKLDVRVRTSNTLAIQASLAQNLQANADLRVRGTVAEPGVLGRVTINEGQLVFFGATYTVTTGTIAFYNPVKIDPILDFSLATQASGVNVVLRVTGPIDNMNLSYTSDPPLQFQEIVSLLAAGKAPTSDPTLLANQPQVPSQSFQQMGESAIVSKALADPVSNRLQRVFGVTQLKIDPSFTTGSEIPTARLTLQQRITSNITFTYTSALTDPNGQIIKIEWAFSPQWAAVANRDQNGIFSVNFFYKKQFR